MNNYDVMLARSGSERIIGKKDYIFEPKLDGYRALCFISENDVKIISRNKVDMTEDFRFDFKIDSGSVVLDGEIIAYDENGKVSFSDVKKSKNVQFIVFDILERDGKDLRGFPLERRKKILDKVLTETKSVKVIVFTEDGNKLLDFVKEKNLEGIVAKRKNSRYVGARSDSWVKVKFSKTIECVVLGFNSKNRKLSSLNLGLFDDRNQLVDVGAVGSGFSEKDLDELLSRIDKNERFVVEVKYHEFTPDKKLRAAVFQKIRDDKSPEECTFEQVEQMNQPNQKLGEYEKKRDFEKTPEPKGEKQTMSDKKIFVIQRHDARRMHYDFRIEDEGVLKSFAVPKGLSNNPSDKRLAIRTENHPISYAKFEGEIPKGEYGGGDVKIWDRGHFVNITIKKGKVIPLSEAIEKGHFLIWTKGEKIEGGYAFTKTGDKEWIVVKMRDGNEKDYEEEIEVDGRKIEITNPKKNLYSGIRKGDIISYYKRVAKFMLPHIKNRPITMQRFPSGIDEVFYQKDIPDYFPSWIKSVKVAHKKKDVNYVFVEDEAGILYLANQVCAIHIWGSRVEKIEYPDRIVFDLDPSKKDYESLRDVAKSLRRFLESIGLKPYIMATGGKGFHLIVPIKHEMKFVEVREFAAKIAGVFEKAKPDAVTTEFRKEKRKERIFIDVNRNSPDQSAIAPYSIRALANFPIAKPFLWEDIDDVTPSSFDIFSKIDTDVWAEMEKDAVSLKKVIEKLGK
jgi:bifunctional non-homologous end joining protein LigD